MVTKSVPKSQLLKSLEKYFVVPLLVYCERSASCSMKLQKESLRAWQWRYTVLVRAVLTTELNLTLMTVGAISTSAQPFTILALNALEDVVGLFTMKAHMWFVNVKHKYSKDAALSGFFTKPSSTQSVKIKCLMVWLV